MKIYKKENCIDEGHFTIVYSCLLDYERVMAALKCSEIKG